MAEKEKKKGGDLKRLFKSVLKEGVSKTVVREKMEKKGVDRSGGKPLKSPEEVMDVSVMEGSARPVDFIKPYYGKDFEREVVKAMLYNSSQEIPILEEDSYARLYDRVPFARDKDKSISASYDTREQKVNLENKKAEEINKSNVERLSEYYDGDNSVLQDFAKSYLRTNSFESYKDYKRNVLDGKVAVEHEFTHHATPPNSAKKKVPMGVGDLMETKYSPAIEARLNALYAYMGNVHTANDLELTQAAAKFQRELFETTGKRIERPEDFIKLVDSDDKMESLSPEARRYLIYARRVRSGELVKEGKIDPKSPREVELNKEYRDKIIESMAEILPATVQNEVDRRKSIEGSFGRADAMNQERGAAAQMEMARVEEPDPRQEASRIAGMIRQQRGLT